MISICIPTFNRTDLLFESFSKVINDDRVSEIVIVDDCSNSHTIIEIQRFIRDSESNKIRLFKNEYNLDCYRNKHEAVSKATNKWVILLDSDNVVDQDYIDCIEGRSTDPKCILQPSFARPHFDFRKYCGMEISMKNVHKYIGDATFETMLNACNFFVNREEYLKVWDGSIDPVTSDSIYFALKWLEAGNFIYVTPGLEYEHRVHDGSHYRNNVRRTPRGFHESIIERLKNMR